MLEAPIVQPSTSTTYSLRIKSKNSMSDDDGDDFDGPNSKARAKSRRELPTGAVETLKAWLLSPEHFTHPYPTPQDQALLMEKTGIDKKQLKNWFTNARRRIWKPMLKKQIEQGKLTAPGLANAQSMENPHSVQAMRVHYQQAIQDQQAGAATAMVDAYANAPSSTDSVDTQPTNQFYDPSKVQNSAMNTLAQVSSSAQLSKTDSHAVLMELFARDQDLVRQATESARLKAEQKQQQQLQQQQQQQQQQQTPATGSLSTMVVAASAAAAPVPASSSQHPMLKAPSASVLHNVPTLNSWPHFSSITSLNNLGTLPGVKSITSLSGQDLYGKGNVYKMGGSLAQVKSMESMGKNDSYAFLEVFFGDRSSNNINGMGGGGGGGGAYARAGGGGGGGGGRHHQQEDDNEEIGLSLDDEAPSGPPPATASMLPPASSSTGLSEKREAMQLQHHHQHHHQQQPMSPPPGMPTVDTEPGTLKRAYDDALAAKGLLSVSRSCEMLTDLPAKMQRTLSQEFFSKRSQNSLATVTSHQYTLHEAKELSQQCRPSDSSLDAIPKTVTSSSSSAVAAASSGDDHVQVSCSTICAMCAQPNIDTQLRPCGHMFHERCLKPSLTNPMGPPKCPRCEIPIHSAVLAVPEKANRL